MLPRQHILDEGQGVGVELGLLVEPSVVEDQPPFPGHLFRNYEGGGGLLAGAWFQPPTLHEFFQLGCHGFKPVSLQSKLTLPEYLVWKSGADLCFAICATNWRIFVGLSTEELLLIISLDFFPQRSETRVGVGESFSLSRYLHHGPHMGILGKVDLVLFRV